MKSSEKDFTKTIIEKDFLIEEQCVKDDTFNLVIYVRPANLFDKNVVNENAIFSRNSTLQELQDQNEILKENVAKYTITKKKSSRNAKEGSRKNTSTVF